MSFSLFKGRYHLDCNSEIRNSSIDMNGGVITSHGTPINGTDVVNKDYVDAAVLAGGGGGGCDQPSVSDTITLTSTNWTTAANVLVGNITITIKNIITNGPSAAFVLCKSEQTRDTSYFRNATCSGLTTNERLEIRWLSNSPIEVRKTGSNYDGTYKVIYNVDGIYTPPMCPAICCDTIILLNTNYTPIIELLFGVVTVHVKNIVSNGPSGSFIVCKSEQVMSPSVIRMGTCSGLTSNERLDIRWDPNSFIEICKTGMNYNGSYSVNYSSL